MATSQTKGCSKAEAVDALNAAKARAKAEAKAGALRYCGKCNAGTGRKRRREERKRKKAAGRGKADKEGDEAVVSSGGGEGGGGGGASDVKGGLEALPAPTGPKRAVILYRGQPRCQDCFITTVEHSFKVVLRKRAAVDRGSVIVAGLSGGPCSTAMLRLLQRCILGRGRSKVLLHVFVVHVDESRLRPFLSDGARRLVSEEDAAAARASLAVFSRSLGFPFVSVPLEAAYQDGLVEGPYAGGLLGQWRTSLPGAPGADAKGASGGAVLGASAGARLDALFCLLFGRGDGREEGAGAAGRAGGAGGAGGGGGGKGTTTASASDPRTAAEDMARVLRMQILRRVAATVGAAVAAMQITQKEKTKEDRGEKSAVQMQVQRGLGDAQAVPFVSLGDNADFCAARAIASIAKGNGCGLRRLVAERDSDIVRPMRDFLGREVAMYLRLSADGRASAPVVLPNFSTMEEGGQRDESKGSINSLCRSLITNLSSTGFSGTALTVIRTTMKLADAPSDHPVCAVCKGTLVGGGGDGRLLCRSCALVAAEVDTGLVKASSFASMVPASISEFLLDEEEDGEEEEEEAGGGGGG